MAKKIIDETWINIITPRCEKKEDILLVLKALGTKVMERSVKAKHEYHHNCVLTGNILLRFYL